MGYNLYPRFKEWNTEYIYRKINANSIISCLLDEEGFENLIEESWVDQDNASVKDADEYFERKYALIRIPEYWDVPQFIKNLPYKRWAMLAWFTGILILVNTFTLIVVRSMTGAQLNLDDMSLDLILSPIILLIGVYPYILYIRVVNRFQDHFANRLLAIRREFAYKPDDITLLLTLQYYDSLHASINSISKAPLSNTQIASIPTLIGSISLIITYFGVIL